MFAVVGEGEAGAGGEVGKGAGDQGLAGGRLVHDPGRHMDGEASDVVATRLDLADMQAATDRHVQFTDRAAKGLRAFDSAGGAVEGDQQAIAGMLDQAALMGVDLLLRQLVVGVELAPPDLIALLRQLF